MALGAAACGDDDSTNASGDGGATCSGNHCDAGVRADAGDDSGATCTGSSCGARDATVPDDNHTSDAGTHADAQVDAGSDAGETKPRPPEPPGAVYYAGHFASADHVDIARFDYPARKVTKLDWQGLSGGASIWALAVSNDGSKLAAAYRETETSPTVLQVYVTATGDVTTLATAPDNDIRDFMGLEFSPDGAWLAYNAPFELSCANCYYLYVVPTDGSSGPATIDGNGSGVDCYKWSPITTSATLLADFGPGGGAGNHLWSIDVGGGMTGMNLGDHYRDGWGCPVFAPSGEIYMLGNLGSVGGDPDVILVAQNATTPGLTVLAGSMLSNEMGTADIGGYSLSPDGSRLAFTAAAPASVVSQVYVLALDGASSAEARSEMTTTRGGSTYGPSPDAPSWSADGKILAVVADWPETDNTEDGTYVERGIWVLAASGSISATHLIDGDNGDVTFSSDGKRLWALSENYGHGSYDLIATPDLTTAHQDASELVVQDSSIGNIDRWLPAP
jgi:hypothetical protein